MYLDPGFGGMMVQIIVAVVALGGVIVFSMRRNIKSFFTKKNDGEDIESASRPIGNLEDDVVDMISDEKSEE